jgi:2-C-methyl-D-erythritol 4-phosphate cytidylyltransferase
MKTAVIIVAGGTGSRMGTETPKQFLLLTGKPLLMHTIERFADTLPGAGLIVVLPEDQQVHWAALCEQYDFTIEHTVVTGGKTRFHSVRNALPETKGYDYIGVHDGVRPLVTPQVIRRTLDAAQDFGAAIPVVPLQDSLREIIRCGECQDMSEIIDSKPADRNRFVAVQTPQFFRANLLLKTYEQDYTPGFTDDASVVESSGQTVTLVPGNAANIKVTTPVDLTIAGVLLEKEGE